VKHAPSLTQRDLERAFQDGFAQGQAERDAALAQRIAALDATARLLENALAAISPALEVEIDALTQKLDKMVRDLAAQRAGMAIDADPSGFGQRIERLALRVSENLTGLRVVLHPTDLAALHAARDANDVPHLARVLACDLRADPSIARGDVRVQGNGLALDDLIEGRT
jgi:flagellar biosynthesis/type III secretory pathway protein FliH